ncbi:S-methyl-5-thioribose-1-phosphate isomerase [Anaerosinus massiliensis]|uniref:S-methyl-5-thioribose-1-phosphate isomerase n=1 Tax=Massilibacillus massiliensis TaxID=1806837 RepID=UPI000A4B514C|nr:S-methyl-5-thioribose-1-phosphate isomerase [Massilibacillus massiliensis]
MQTMIWHGDHLELLNQTKLPKCVEYIKCNTYQIVGEAIKKLEVRGAPAIGAAAAFGFVLGAKQLKQSTSQDIFLDNLFKINSELRETRPTAVNLFWALDRMLHVVKTSFSKMSVETLLDALENEAIAIFEEDKAINLALSKHGATLFSGPTAVLTHCNAGALATAGIGTALGVIRQSHAEGNITRVFADETRPLLQGARLTAFELLQDRIPVTLITDNMAGWVMKNKMIHAVIVGADRITANGDVANKIGTYSIAILAKEHGIPFYVAAPSSTFDFLLTTGEEIPIEERKKEEVTYLLDTQIAPLEVDVFNPAFDVTPHQLITGIITEYGILRSDYTKSIQELKERLER